MIRISILVLVCANIFNAHAMEEEYTEEYTEVMEPFTCTVSSLASHLHDMQDFYAINNLSKLIKLKGTQTPLWLFGIFDGHGLPHGEAFRGDRISRYLAENLGLIISAKITCYNINNLDIPKIIRESIELVNNFARDIEYVGSTAVFVVLWGERLWLCNVGDSRGLLVREADCSREIIATRDHKPNDILERERIQASGGRIKYERGCYRLERLALSRGVGDYPRIRGYSTEVDITEYCISGLKYIILASDGIWDGLSNKEVVDYIYFYKNIGRSLEQITQGLINKVSDKNDDKTIMILYFNQ